MPTYLVTLVIPHFTYYINLSESVLADVGYCQSSPLHKWLCYKRQYPQLSVGSVVIHFLMKYQ